MCYVKTNVFSLNSNVVYFFASFKNRSFKIYLKLHRNHNKFAPFKLYIGIFNNDMRCLLEIIKNFEVMIDCKAILELLISCDTFSMFLLFEF